jgi:hypothetical protein
MKEMSMITTCIILFAIGCLHELNVAGNPYQSWLHTTQAQLKKSIFSPKRRKELSSAAALSETPSDMMGRCNDKKESLSTEKKIKQGEMTAVNHTAKTMFGIDLIPSLTMSELDGILLMEFQSALPYYHGKKKLNRK